MASRVTTAKASLISNRSTSSTPQSSFFISLSMAPTGAMVNSLGCREWVLWPSIRAMGVAPSRSAAAWLERISAEAPSEMELELAAVMVPSLAKAGRRARILSSLAWKGCSSWSTTLSPWRLLTVTGAISASRWPALVASMARSSEAMAKSSRRSRL